MILLISDQELLQAMAAGDQSAFVTEPYERLETTKEIWQSLKEVPGIQRDIIVLRFYRELKLQEIADTLGLTLNTVKTYLYRGLKKLKGILELKVMTGEGL